jgi:hypothetical protein
MQKRWVNLTMMLKNYEINSSFKLSQDVVLPAIQKN